MQIKQFEDKNLSHFSYAILSDCDKKIVLIDPARNPAQYINFAKENQAQIIGIIETHLHADFISGHLELHHLTNATIYISKLGKALYPHQTFDEGDYIQFGKLKLTAINTPGHSPDSICILLEHHGKQKAIFTGDTLFIGDCGRPDLRENKENVKTSRAELAKQLYHSLRDKLLPLLNDTLVYPAHGAGTLCGKLLLEANSSTVGAERNSNWSLQPQPEHEFVAELLSGQPFIPAYFLFDVNLNKQGAPSFSESIKAVPINKVIDKDALTNLDTETWIIDTREEKEFKKGHLAHSINLMEGTKFETWLGSIIQPKEHFYLAAATADILNKMIERTASIGYEIQIKAAFVSDSAAVKESLINIENFKAYPENYTIIDIRNREEVFGKKIFLQSIAIPLSELRSRIKEIATDKPIVVHCAGGYRSAAGSSLLQSALGSATKVFDLGEAINQF